MTTVNFGTSRRRDAGDQLGAVLGDAAGLVLAADHEAGDVLQEHERDAALAAQLDEVRALQRDSREQDAVVGEDADRMPWMCAKPQTSVGAVERLNSSNSEPSTMRAITSRTSYGLRGSAGTTP
jgi:hypothetical protein